MLVTGSQGQVLCCCRDSTTAELRSITATDAEKQNMLDILQKLHEQQLDDDVHSDADSGSEDEAEGHLSQQTVQQLARKVTACHITNLSVHTRSARAVKKPLCT